MSKRTVIYLGRGIKDDHGKLDIDAEHTSDVFLSEIERMTKKAAFKILILIFLFAMYPFKAGGFFHCRYDLRE